MCGIVFMVDRNLVLRNIYLGTTIFTKSIHKRCIARYLKLFSTQLSRQDPPIMTGAPPPFIKRP